MPSETTSSPDRPALPESLPLIYRVTHVTTYHYSGNAVACHNLLHLTPRDTPHQRLLSHALVLQPDPISEHRFQDYWGNSCVIYEIHEPHAALKISMRCRVVVDPQPTPEPGDSLSWDLVRLRPGHPSHLPVEVREFAFHSAFTRSTAELRDYALVSFPDDRPLLEGALDLTRRIHADFKYDPAATTISTPVEEVFSKRGGVCQDFAHLQLACLRSLGLPARYVSGYLQTHAPPGKERLQGADASHAWIALFVPHYGWVDLDPTNNLIPGHEHITTAWGRDYQDVAPVAGVFTGSEAHAVKVAVDVEPERVMPVLN